MLVVEHNINKDSAQSTDEKYACALRIVAIRIQDKNLAPVLLRHRASLSLRLLFVCGVRDGTGTTGPIGEGTRGFPLLEHHNHNRSDNCDERNDSNENDQHGVVVVGLAVSRGRNRRGRRRIARSGRAVRIRLVEGLAH